MNNKLHKVNNPTFTFNTETKSTTILIPSQKNIILSVRNYVNFNETLIKEINEADIIFYMETDDELIRILPYKYKTNTKYTKYTKVHLNRQSKPITYNNPINTYTKDNLFCILTKDNIVHKYPLTNIFRIKETY